MKSNLSDSAYIAIAFATGFVAGILYAPHSGDVTRKRITEQAGERLRAAEKQLEAVEEQLAEVNASIQEKGKALGGKVRKAAQDMVDQYMPDLSGGSSEWSEDGEDDVVRDLRNMTRK